MTTTWAAGDDVDDVDDGQRSEGMRRPEAADGPAGTGGPTGRRRLLVLLAAGAVVVALALTWLVAVSSVFGVSAVRVRGTGALTAAQVRAAAKVVDGTPLMRVDTAAVTRRVERLADVASAEVSTSFPSTLTITVIERQPVAYIGTGGRATLVDRTGDRYRTVASAPAHLPRLVAGTTRTTDAALASVAAALPAAVREQVLSVQALDPDSITLLLRGNRIVRWGSDDRSADKARVLPVLLRSNDDQIDVTDPDQPYTH